VFKKRPPPDTPQQAATRHLLEAFDAVGEAWFTLGFKELPRRRKERERLFRMLAGAQANCEIVKLWLKV